MSSFVNLMVHPLTFYVNGMSFVIPLVALVFTGSTGRGGGGATERFGRWDVIFIFCFVGSLVLK